MLADMGRHILAGSGGRGFTAPWVRILDCIASSAFIVPVCFPVEETPGLVLSLCNFPPRWTAMKITSGTESKNNLFLFVLIFVRVFYHSNRRETKTHSNEPNFYWPFFSILPTKPLNEISPSISVDAKSHSPHIPLLLNEHSSAYLMVLLCCP